MAGLGRFRNRSDPAVTLAGSPRIEHGGANARGHSESLGDAEVNWLDPPCFRAC
jgi:hypothetical protein